MAKHALTALFIFFFTYFATAQLTLQRVNGSKKHVIPVGALMGLSFPIKTQEMAEEAEQTYIGKLKNTSKTSIDMILTYENRYYTTEYGVKIREEKNINPLDSPTIVQMPLVKLQYITHHFDRTKKFTNGGALVFGLAVFSNLFIAPHLKAPYNKTVRNAGYLVMGVSLTTAFIPTRKRYYLEQPVGRRKTLWKIVQ